LAEEDQAALIILQTVATGATAPFLAVLRFYSLVEGAVGAVLLPQVAYINPVLAALLAPALVGLRLVAGVTVELAD
jgi:hypothetical protein